MNPTYQNKPFPSPYPAVPLFPIYGYDNSEEAEKDFDTMKRLYPRSSRKIQDLIEDTCDQLEYEGSIMFDEYPDRLQIALMANKIYSQVAPSATPELTQTASPSDRSSDRQAPPWRPTPPPDHDRNPDWLRNMIEIMLCNEMCQRRRRYRSRRRWM